MKSKKYKIHLLSKEVYPTKVTRGSGSSRGGMTVGHVPARRELERNLGRSLHPDTKIKTKGNNWAFLEPR